MLIGKLKKFASTSFVNNMDFTIDPDCCSNHTCLSSLSRAELIEKERMVSVIAGRATADALLAARGLRLGGGITVGRGRLGGRPPPGYRTRLNLKDFWPGQPRGPGCFTRISAEKFKYGVICKVAVAGVSLRQGGRSPA